MKTYVLFTVLLLAAMPVWANSPLYSKAYGDAKNPAVIFLHGGPGYNAVSFEHTTARRLADEAHCYVIVYDQRGCGRNPTDAKAKFTFKEAFADLNGIYQKYTLKKATLIGHSFGGTLGILFAQKYTKQVQSLVLEGSPLSYPITFTHIIARCREIYTQQGKTDQLAYLDMLQAMDSTTLAYSSYCFMHAMQAGFYAPKQQTDEAKALYTALKKHADAAYLSHMTREPVSGFFENEKYTRLTLSAVLKKVAGKVPVYGIYGQEDGLFNEAHLAGLRSLVSPEHFWVVEGASHSVFIDQQTQFVERIKPALVIQ